MKKIEIELYTTDTGKCPFEKWSDSLTIRVRAIIHKRITRLEVGHFGDAKSLKEFKGLYELRIHGGPGYRIYFGKKGNVIVILLYGGQKKTQSQDISKAKKYWQDYLKHNEGQL